MKLQPRDDVNIRVIANILWWYTQIPNEITKLLIDHFVHIPLLHSPLPWGYCSK